MIVKIEDYFVEEGRPSLDDVKKCVEIAGMEDELVRLNWYIRYNGYHDIIIHPEYSAESVYDQLPKSYGL